MAQVVYYFYAAVRLGAPERPVAFSVPTGNFGDVFAGYVAAKMGLPVAKLIVATNVNDILHRALSDGRLFGGHGDADADARRWTSRSARNFERLLFDLGGRDGAALAAQMQGFEATRAMRLTNAQREGAAALFTSARIDPDDMALAMRWACDEARAGDRSAHRDRPRRRARAPISRDVPVVTLATAHPGQVPRRGRARDRRAPGAARADRRSVRPRGALRRRCPATFEAVTGYIAERGRGRWRDARDAHRRALGRLRADRLGQWPQARALWPLPLHPPRAAGAVGAAPATTGTPTAEFVPGSDEEGGGRWHFAEPVPREGWPLKWDDVTLHRADARRSAISASSPTWRRSGTGCASASPGMEAPECLNLFGYTGVGTLAMAGKGARMVHVDASKKSVEAARANAVLSGMADKPIRWMIDDADQVHRARGAPRPAL